MSELQHIETIGPDATGLRTSMEMRGDRFIHVVDWFAGEQSLDYLESVEGTDEDLLAPQSGVTTIID